MSCCKKSLKISKGGTQNPYIKEQTTQWPKEKVQMDKQRSTKQTHKTKDRVTRTPLKTLCLKRVLNSKHRALVYIHCPILWKNCQFGSFNTTADTL